MDANKRQRYEKISLELTRLVGGKETIQGVAHCATRLRIVLKDNDIADLKAIEDVDLAKACLWPAIRCRSYSALGWSMTCMRCLRNTTI